MPDAPSDEPPKKEKFCTRNCSRSTSFSCRKLDNIVLFEFNPALRCGCEIYFCGILNENFISFKPFYPANSISTTKITRIFTKISDSETKLKTLLETIARLQKLNLCFNSLVTITIYSNSNYLKLSIAYTIIELRALLPITAQKLNHVKPKAQS